METFDLLWEYCSSNSRLCPKPDKWSELYNLLKNKKQKPSGGWEPSLPLILGAWQNTMPIEKHLRFKEHIEWAAKNNQLNEIGNYLRKLDESEWIHFGEI